MKAEGGGKKLSPTSSVVGDEPDPPPGFRFRGRHEFPDGVEDHLELTVVSRFQFIQTPSEFLICRNHLTQLDECSHNVDACLHCPLATQQIRNHQGTVLGVDPGSETDVSMLLGSGHNL